MKSLPSGKYKDVPLFRVPDGYLKAVRRGPSAILVEEELRKRREAGVQIDDHGNAYLVDENPNDSWTYGDG